MSSFGGTVKLTGESEYQKALRGITDNLKVLTSEMKIVTSQYDRNDKSTSNLSQQNTVLNKKIEEQKQKVEILKNALRDAEQETGKNSSTSQKWRVELNNAQAELNKLQKSVSDNEKAMDDFGEETEESGKSVSRLGELIKANLISDAIKVGIKGLATAVKGVATAFVDLGKQAIASYGEYEQLVGGVETLFGAGGKSIEEYAKSVGKTVDEVKTEYDNLMKSQQAVLDNASNAWMSSGLSVNQYMETVTSFSASLLQSLEGDTVKSAEIANMAIIDMSDNANKMGTSMESIQNAYQAFAKGNWTLLDNLKLGYGGTAREMARLVNESGILGDALIDLDDKQNLNVALQEVGYARIIEAIHKVQTEIGITGTTAEEANRTITGSTSAMKSAWANLVTGIADDNANFERLVDNLVVSIVGEGGEGGVLSNILPRIKTALDGIVKMVTSLTTDLLPEIMKIGVDLILNLATSISENLPTLLESARTILDTLINGIVELLPTLVPIAVQILSTLVSGLVSILPELLSVGGSFIDTITAGLQDNLPTFISKGLDLIEGLADFLTKNVPILIEKGMELLRGLVKGLMEALPELISRVPEIISKFANVINDNAPTIIQGGISMLTDLVKGIISAIPTLVANIPKIIKALLDVWEAFNWVNLGKNAIEFVSNGIKGMLGFAKNSMKSITDGATSMIKDLPQNLWNIGKNAISNLGNAISSLKTWVVNSIKTVGTNMLNSIKSVLSWDNIKTIGKNLIEGLWNGISDMSGWIINKLYGFGESVLSGIKDFFGIKSPSKKTAEIGGYLGEGLAVGLTSSEKKVLNTVQKQCKAIEDAMLLSVQSGAFETAGKNAVANFSSAVEKEGKTAVESVTKMVNNTVNSMTEQLTDEINAKKKNYKKTLDSMIEELTNEYNAKKKKYKELGDDSMVEQLTKEFNAEKKKYKESIDSMLEQLSKELKKKKTEYKELGKDLIESFSKGIDEQVNNVIAKESAKVGMTLSEKIGVGFAESERDLLYVITRGCETLEKDLLKSVKKGNFEEAGKTAIDKFTSAIESKETSLKESITNLVNSAVTQMTKANDSKKSEYEKLGKGIIESFTSGIEAETEKAVTSVESAISKITQTAQDKLDEVKSKQSSFQSLLQVVDGDLFDYEDKTGEVVLTNLKKGNKELKEYGKDLEILKGLVSQDLLDEIVSIDEQGDAAKYAEKLLSMSDKELKAYDKAYSERIKLSKSISKRFYSNQVDEINKEFTENVAKEMEKLTKKMKTIGQDAVKGFTKGIKSKSTDLEKSLKEFSKSIIKQIKKEFKINSPSKVMSDEVGKNLALGVGEGFSSTMADVSADMNSAIPREYDFGTNTRANYNSASNYNMMLSAFKQALTEVKVVMNNREMGNFVTDTIERAVFA